MTENARRWMFDVLAAPAHAWLWICARLCGSTFEYGPVEDDDDEDEDE